MALMKMPCAVGTGGGDTKITCNTANMSTWAGYQNTPYLTFDVTDKARVTGKIKSTPYYSASYSVDGGTTYTVVSSSVGVFADIDIDVSSATTIIFGINNVTNAQPSTLYLEDLSFS